MPARVSPTRRRPRGSGGRDTLGDVLEMLASLTTEDCVASELLGLSVGKMERRVEESCYRCFSIQECGELYPKKADKSTEAK